MPNLVFDSSKPFSEDDYQEARLERCLLRAIGPTGRCPYVYKNWQKHEENPSNEPHATIKSFRSLKQKPAIFGAYFQIEILDDASIYERVFPSSLGYPEFS
jgi:uncharacterized protein YcbX